MSRFFPLADGIDDFTTTICTIATNKDIGNIRRSTQLIACDNATRTNCDLGENSTHDLCLFLLANCLENHVALLREFRSRNLFQFSVRRHSRSCETNPNNMTINFYNADWHRIKQKVNAVMLCLFEFKWIRRHLRLASAIDHRHLLRSKPNRLSCRIDCSISAADDYDLMPHRDFVQWFGMNLLDKIQSIKTLWKIFPIDSKSITVTKS